MVSLKTVELQLAKVGMNNTFFGKPEIRELCHILAPGEVITNAVNGQYEGGFAMMLTTDRRILLIDKKPWFLTMEDIRYDMVSEVDFYGRLLNSSLSLVTIGKTLKFTSWRQDKLRQLVKYIQHKVMELRNINDSWQDDSRIKPLVQSPTSTNATYQQLPFEQKLEEDFSKNYKTFSQRHSLAHVAGNVAVNLTRRRLIVKPLYTRPPLISKYKQNGLPIQSAHEVANSNY
jgi:hypothetical protein